MNHHVLLIEDSDEDFEFTVMALRRSGLKNEIARCASGDAALDRLFSLAESEPNPNPNLILLDLNLPGTDGREVLSRIKKDPDLKRIPVIVLTTSGDQVDIDDCYQRGANSYVQKPVDFTDLMQAIERLKVYWFEVVVLPGN